MKRLCILLLLLFFLSAPALAAPELPDQKIYSVRSDDVFVVTPDGYVVAWGTNDTGIIPDFLRSDNYFCDYVNRFTAFDGAASLSGGYLNLFIVTVDGELHGYGPYDNFTYAGKESDGNSKTVKIMDDVVMVSGGYDHFSALKADGSVWDWGRDPYTDELFGPVEVLGGCKYVSGYSAVKNNGDLYAWGPGYLTPTRIKSGVFALTYDLIQMKNGVVYEYIPGDLAGSFLREPIARNVRKLCDGGYITEDGALYAKQDDGSYVELLSGGVESAMCGSYIRVAITDDGYVYTNTVPGDFSTFACVGTVDSLVQIPVAPLILSAAKMMLRLVPLLVPLS